MAERPPQRTVIAPLTEVTVHGGTKGVILSATIFPAGVTYTVGYWSGTDWRTDSFDEGLVTQAGDREPLRVGFKRE
jgi:hypothetical protein